MVSSLVNVYMLQWPCVFVCVSISVFVWWPPNLKIMFNTLTLTFAKFIILVESGIVVSTPVELYIYDITPREVLHNRQISSRLTSSGVCRNCSWNCKTASILCWSDGWNMTICNSNNKINTTGGERLRRRPSGLGARSATLGPPPPLGPGSPSDRHFLNNFSSSLAIKSAAPDFDISPFCKNISLLSLIRWAITTI